MSTIKLAYPINFHVVKYISFGHQVYFFWPSLMVNTALYEKEEEPVANMI